MREMARRQQLPHRPNSTGRKKTPILAHNKRSADAYALGVVRCP
jgi:hypothetical protein